MKELIRVDKWGIESSYKNTFGKWCKTSHKTRAAILAAMKINLRNQPNLQKQFKIVKEGQTIFLRKPGKLLLEDKTSIYCETKLPKDLPLGYHKFFYENDECLNIIVTPLRCYLPHEIHDRRGFALQLYALRSKDSWGIGDLKDLKNFAGFAKKNCDMDLLLLNPLLAPLPTIPQNASPYFPSSRLYKNLLYLNIEEIPYAKNLQINLDELANMGHELNKNRLIDRDKVLQLKLTALRKIWKDFSGDARFDAYLIEEGMMLEDFAIFCVLAEHHKSGWKTWPKQYQYPHTKEVEQFAKKHNDSVKFYKWLQWLLDVQFKQAANKLPLFQDLPIGVDPNGFDAWFWQDLLATDVAIGAPPDAFSNTGQNWGMPPFIPYKLHQEQYEPFRQVLRANLRYSSGLRIDHVMGLFHMFWIPKHIDNAKGAYVRYNSDDLLAILALESYRAKATIIGEDLGTVAKGIRNSLRKNNILSSRVLYFAKENPVHYPKLAMVDIGTHDMPTVAGLWGEADLEEQEKAGLEPNVKANNKILQKFIKLLNLQKNAKIEEVIANSYRALMKSKSAIKIFSLPNILGIKERINMPNTTALFPNWSLAYPFSLAKIKSNLIKFKINVLSKEFSGEKNGNRKNIKKA